jgi:MFS family permease
MLAICLPLMIASRFAGAGELLLYVGLGASFILPFSIYGSSIGLFQSMAPVQVRATVMGVAMMSLNIVALSLGTLWVGWLADLWSQAGNTHSLRWAMLAFDGLTALALIGYVGAALCLRRNANAP